MTRIFVNPTALAQIALDDRGAVFQMRQGWQTIIEEDPESLRTLYDEIIEAAERLLGTRSKPRCRLFGLLPAKERDTDLTDYVFLQVAASSDYLQRLDIKQAAENCLSANSPRLLTLIRRFADQDDRKITNQPRKTETGGIGDCGKALIHLYFYHCLYGPESQRLRAEVAPTIPAILRAFPEGLNNLVVSLLNEMTDFVPEAGSLVEDLAVHRGLMDCGTIKTIAFELLSRYSRRDSSFHKHANAILAPTLERLATADDTSKAAFVQRFVLYPLECDQTNQANEIAKVVTAIARHEAELASPDTGPPPYTSPELRQGWLERDRKKLQVLEADFEGWQQQRFTKAVQRVAVSTTTRRVLTQIAKTLAPYRDPMLDRLLNEVESYRNRPRTYQMPKRRDNRFKDFGFKLLVIEDLMYRQQCLTPRFDIYTFADEYDKREISVEDDGYEIIPEVETYFRNLAIPDALLARVESLHQSSGLDGGPEFIRHLYPFWDPGAGDEVIKVSAKAVQDLPLLPNLRRISGLENSRPSKALLSAFEERGITLIDEEDA